MDWYLDASRSESTSALRREVFDYIARHAEEGSDLDDVGITLSELLGNVARHAPGPAWVAVRWSGMEPVLSVYDLGPGFDLPSGLPDPMAESGRGLYIVGALTPQLEVSARRAGGAVVSVTLPVRRATMRSFDPPMRATSTLPLLSEASPDGGFGKEPFLRALVVQLAQAVGRNHGPDAAEAAVAQVGIDVGSQMEEEYRQAKEVVGRLRPDQLADCLVRLKHAIGGGFFVVEITDERIVLGTDSCPFGDVVRRAPSLCRMTSSVFGGIAARNTDDGAAVVLDERIALGDPGCRVVVHLGPAPEPSQPVAHRYRSPADAPPDES